MNPTIQFRCTSCMKLLFKFDRDTGKAEYSISQYDFWQDEEGNMKYVDCPKCGEKLEVTKTGMKRRNPHIEARHHIKTAEPVLERPAKQRESVWQRIRKWLNRK